MTNSSHILGSVGEQGHPERTRVVEMGPLLQARLRELSEAQEGIINIAFRLSVSEGLPLLDLKDLQALLVWIGEQTKELSMRFGNVSSSSINEIHRRLLVFENQGGRFLCAGPARQSLAVGG